MIDQDLTTIVKDELDGKEKFPCVKCPHREPFKSAAALRMHKIRIHSRKKWDTSKNFHKGAQNREERLATRRAYQRRLRERYYAEGRNSKGEKMPKGWKPNAKRRAARVALSRTKEYQRQYQRNWYAKRHTRNQESPQNTSTTSTTPDITGEAAKAIMVAASVIRAVQTGMKITNL